MQVIPVFLRSIIGQMSKGAYAVKRLAGCLLAILLVLVFSAALAQRVSCPDGGFSLDLPDSFYQLGVGGDPDLCFHWSDGTLDVAAYASYQGEVAGSDLFQVLDGSEIDYGTKTISGTSMKYVRSEGSISYSWMDRGNSVTLEFSYPPGDSSSLDAAKSIVRSIRFDAGH